MAESPAWIEIEVACALPHCQRLLSLRVPSGCTLREAVVRSGIAQYFPELAVDQAPLGIFGRWVAEPERYSVQAGDRIEIYRPLLVDPREARRQRVAQARG